MTTVALTLAALTLLLPACAGSRSSSSTATTASTAPKQGLRVQSVATIEAERGWLYSVVVWGHYVGWASSTEPRTQPNRVVVHDLDSKTTRVVARTKFPGGSITWVQGNKDSVVYVDLARATDDFDPRTRWHMYEFNLMTGQERRLASSTTPTSEAYPLLPSIVWPWVAWLEATDTPGRVAVRSLDLRDGRQRTLVPSTSGEQLSMDDITVSVVYDDDNGSGGRDIYAVPADGSGAPTRLTTSGLADFAIAGNGGFVWQQPPHADSDSLWYMALPSGPPLRFSTRSGTFPAGSSAAPGRGFVIWNGVEGLTAGDPSRTLPPVRLDTTPGVSLNTAARWWVDGDRVVWAMDRGIGSLEERSTVYIAKIAVP